MSQQPNKCKFLILQTINLRNNKLSSGYDAFVNIPSLKNLDLSGNLFTALSAHVRLPNLRVLDLSENQITSITGAPFAGLSVIIILHLDFVFCDC